MRTRREFLGTVGAGLALAGAPWSVAAGGRQRPNVVLMLADDMSWCDAGCYGNPDVRTPNLDTLAGEGLRFTRAFTATAMCAPTRQQLYTGVFPIRNGAYPNHSVVFDGTRSMVHHLRELGYRVGHRVGKTHFGPPESFPFDAVENLAGYFSAPEPFCLVVASVHPHLPWPEAHDYDPERLTLPPHFVDTPETREALSRYYEDVGNFDTELGGVLDTLEASGQAGNTLVIATSEQGAAFPMGKWSCHDYGLRTQFVARWPRVIPPGTTTDAMIQYVDVVPTLVALAGGDPETLDSGLPGGTDGGRGVDGRSFLPVLLGETDRHNEVVFGAHTNEGIRNGAPYPIRSARDGRYKYIRNLRHEATFQNNITEVDVGGYWASWVRAAETDPHAARRIAAYTQRPAEELYDVLRDPYELENLAAEPSLTDVKARLGGLLDAWMAQQGDLGMETELAAPSRQPRNRED